jgi:hypothetical protein
VVSILPHTALETSDLNKFLYTQTDRMLSEIKNMQEFFINTITTITIKLLLYILGITKMLQAGNSDTQPTQPPIHWIPRFFPWEVKRPRPEANNSSI